MWSIAFRPTGWKVRGAVAVRVERLVTRGEDAAVAVAIDEGVRRVAVGADRGVLVDAVLVFEQGGRRSRGLRPAGSRSPRTRRHVATSRAMSCTPSPCGTSRCALGVVRVSGEARTNVMSPWRRT